MVNQVGGLKLSYRPNLHNKLCFMTLTYTNNIMIVTISIFSKYRKTIILLNPISWANQLKWIMYKPFKAEELATVLITN